MNKKVDGLELLRMIRDNEHKNKTFFDLKTGKKLNIDVGEIWYVDGCNILNDLTIIQLINRDFEILQEDKIEKIEKLGNCWAYNTDEALYDEFKWKINEIIDKLNSMEGEDEINNFY